MTPQQLAAMKMALDLATMHHTDDGYAALRAKVRSASKEALAQPEQEPLFKKIIDQHPGLAEELKALDEQEPEAWYDKHGMVTHDPFEGVTPLYTTPPAQLEHGSCGNCNGSGRMPRDPDIGTDQECFVCDGTGKLPKEPEQEPVAIADGTFNHNCPIGTPLYTKEQL